MTVLTAARPGRGALAAGRAQPTRTVRHVHSAARPLVFVPLELAGEACAPLAVMVGDDPRQAAAARRLRAARPRPAVRVRRRPRRHRARLHRAATVAAEEARRAAGSPAPLPRRPAAARAQPGRRAFPRLLGRSTRFRRTEGEYAVRPPSLLGRWLTYFAERAEVPGSASCSP